MNANDPIVIDSEDSDTESSEEMVDLVRILSGNTHSIHAGNSGDSTEARFEVMLGWDKNWRQRQPVGVLVVVEMRGLLGGAAARQMLRSLSQQVDDALNYFTRMTRRGRQYAQDDEEFSKWIANAGTQRQDRMAYGIDNLTRILTRRPPIIELERIPVTSVLGNGEDFWVHGRKERTLFYQEPALVGRLDDVAVHSNEVAGLDLEVQELARQGRVRSVRTFRVWDVEIM